MSSKTTEIKKPVGSDNVAEEPDAKRQKPLVKDLVKEIVSSDIPLDNPSELKEKCTKSSPYPHSQVENLFQPEFMTKLRDEIKANARANFKESDLFRVYQTFDMANLDDNPELATVLPNVMTLRELLYSQEWRSFIEQMVGLEAGTLNTHIDCAFNCHAPGCHLLCHDDVIGTRRVSYIIYLTEEDWEAQEGGSLELYGDQSDDKDGTSSDPTPVSRVWPKFNSMAFFEVVPGQSFHAVQEVLGDRPRLSLQGWYHCDRLPENYERATLQQLKQRDEGSDTSDKSDSKLKYKFQEEKPDEVYSEEDRKYLSKYIQEIYLTEESMEDVRKKFEEDSSVQLRNFLVDKWVPKVEPQKEVTYDDAHYKWGISSEWKIRGPAHKQRFLEYHEEVNDPDDSKIVGSLMHHVKTNVFQSEPFSRYLKRITSLGKPMGVKEGQIRWFRPGLDYTVAHHGLLMNQSVLDATMCFVCDDTEEDKDAWESGDIGGFECYIEAEDNEEADDEYNEEDDTELLSVSASNNTLSLVYRDPGTMRFVKYVGNSAPSSRYDINMEYTVPESTEESEAEEEVDVGF